MTARDDLAQAFKSAVLDKTEWRPVASRPKEGTVSLVCLAVGGVASRRAAAIFRDGRWLNGKGNRPLQFEPTHWLAWLDD